MFLVISVIGVDYCDFLDLGDFGMDFCDCGDYCDLVWIFRD